MICGLDSTGPRTQFLEKKEFSLTSWIPSPRFLVFHFLAYWERALGISHLTTESVKNAISPALFLFGWTTHSLKEAYRSFCIRAISRANSNGESNEWNMNRNDENRKSKKKEKRKENSALCIPIILTISKNRSYTKYPYTKYPSTKYHSGWASMPPSSSGSGHLSFKEATGIRLPLGVGYYEKKWVRNYQYTQNGFFRGRCPSG